MADVHKTHHDSHFQFLLHKFNKSIDNSNVICIDINLKYGICVSLSKEGVLVVNNIQKSTACVGSGNLLASEKLNRFALNVGNEREVYQILVSSDSGKLGICEEQNGQLCCHRQFDVKSLLSPEIEEEISSVELVLFKDDWLTLFINKHQLVTCSVKEGQYKVLSNISVPYSNDQSPDYTGFHVVEDICIVVDWNSTISFYSIGNGEVYCEVDITKLHIDSSTVQTWYISDDLRYIVLVQQCGDLHCIDLQRYCGEFMQGRQQLHNIAGSTVITQDSQLSQHRAGSSSHWYKTCQYGDIPWRERLLSLHSYHHRPPDEQILQGAKSYIAHSSINKGKTGSRTIGFKSKRHAKNSEVKFVDVIKAPDIVQGYSVEDMFVDKEEISVVYGYNGVCILCLWNTETRGWKTHRFRDGERVMLSKLSSMPHVIVSETCIKGMITTDGMDQEQFVSELMVYGGAVLADTVCHLNNWGRSSMPLNTLQIGLKHRQHDTVAFFLKSKEKLFSSTYSTNQQYKQEASSPSRTPQFSYEETISQLESAVSLIIEAVRDTMVDRHAQLFGQQVLDILLDFLYELMLDGLTVSELALSDHEKKDLHKATEKLLEYIESSRACVHCLEQAGSVSRSETTSTSSVSGLSFTNIIHSATPEVSDVPDSPTPLVPEWDRMDIETVIEDGIMKNMIPELQQYLLQREEHTRADYSELKKTGIMLAVSYVKFGNMDKAKEILYKLGLNVAEELWNIALFTQETTLCNSIIEELLSGSSLTGEQVSMVKFYKELNELYPCRNFEDIQNKHPHVKDSESHEVHRLRSLINQTAQYDLEDRCGNLGHQDTADTAPEDSGSHYNEVLLAWIQHWDQKSRNLVKLDVLINKTGSNIGMFDKRLVWGYLLSRNMSDVLVAWIHNSFPSNHAVKEELKWPVTHLGKLLPEFVNYVDHCTKRTRSKIIKAFASHGIYTDEAFSSFEVMLQHVNQIGGPLQLPHPLQQCQPDVLRQFHSDMILYCIQHNLPYFLWTYVCLHRLPGDFLQSLCDGLEDRPWLPLFLKFVSVTFGNELRQCMHDASLMNAVAVWGHGRGSVGELLQSGHTLAALATLMYSHHQLQQVTFVTQQLDAFDGLSSEVVEKALQGFPKLQVTLFPASKTDQPHTDVSVYQLLLGNAPFDPAKLFGWQSTNTCAGEDCIKEMPYFSHPGLVAKYGYSEQLKYTYYLKQARPSFAFVAFLAEEFKNGGHTIPSKRLAVAIGTSLWMGVKHFPDPQISSSCVVFQELLGHDSLMLRMYLKVGSEILAYRNQAVTGTMDRRREQVKKNEQEVVEMLLDCIQIGRQFAPTVLSSLEAAILAAVTRDRLSLFEASQRWLIAVLFCHMMHLPYTTVFLESCAEARQWLPFIWFAQLHQYPKEQLLNLLHKFQSRHLQEHLQYVLTNAEVRSSQAEEKKVQAKQRSERVAKDVRSNLYSRIGLVKGADSEASSTEDEESHVQMSGAPPSLDQEEEDAALEVTYDSSPDDVFGVVFAAQNSRCPWKSLLLHSVTLRNCLFAELACSLEGASVLPCLCGWLVSMMEVTEHSQFLENYGKSPWRYTIHTLDAILDLCIKKKWGSLLVTGFDIFQESSPLIPFLQFYSDFTERRNYTNCRLLLAEFKESVFQFHHEKSVKAEDYIGDSDWLEKTTYRIIQYMLTSTPSVHDVTQLLNILEAESITLIFKTVDPDFRRQSKLMTIIEEGELDNINFSALLGPTSDLYKKECLSVIDQLMEKQMFSKARKFGAEASVATDHVTLRQLQYEKEKLSSTDLWKSMDSRLRFYKDCCLKFNKHQVPTDAVVDFFEKEIALTSVSVEKACMYELCLHCMKQGSEMSEQTGSVINRKLWLCKIQAKLEAAQTNETPQWRQSSVIDELEAGTPNKEKQELMFCGKMPRSSDISDSLEEKEVQAVRSLAGDLLRNGEITKCCRLLTEFNVYLQDLAIILTCIRLSMGTLTLDTMTPDMLHLLRSKPGHVHRQSIASPVPLLRNASTVNFMSNIQPVIESVSIENEATISAMECLLNHCNDGRQMCIRIITAFKIADVLCIGYDDVITGDDYYILRSLLKTNCSAKFRLAADFLGTSSLSAEQVAGFLSDSIVQSYKASLGEEVADKELFFDPGEDFSDFNQIVGLCKEPSLLGNRLVDNVVSMSGDLEETSGKVLTLQTELLIKAHECYTNACDMEGISNILRAARILTVHLQAATEFSLMTRLLTGVGRYNEMVYIFDSLKQNHQFELLLGKGMEKVTKLKTAILDYLKRYHPTDTETYTMVALNFLMYREIAQLLEDNAEKILDKLKGKPLDNSTETQTNLQKVAQYLSEAAESYIKDSCVRHAQACIRKARLVALQIKYLPANQQFINLTTKGANLLIADHPVFPEAFIISEAYKQKDSWAVALCNNVINLGNMKYLTDFRSHIRITPQLIEDAVDRYQQSSEKSPQAPSNIRKLLLYCKDVRVQYRIAKQLGLRELVVSLEKGDAKSYIMDFSKTPVQ